MLKEALVEHCSPTLAGIKTGNIFTVENRKEEINSEIRELNGVLTPKGLRLVPIKETEKTTLIYLYRPNRLKKDLSNPEATKILKDKGYACDNCGCCLVQLVDHLKNDKSFPHEIGLFLGYPPSDVVGFMNSPCKGVKCTGCWKAYGNEEEAKRTFESYKRCKAVYRREIKMGRPLEKLIVNE